MEASQSGMDTNGLEVMRVVMGMSVSIYFHG